MGTEPKQDADIVKTSALQPGVLEELDLVAGFELSSSQVIERQFIKNQSVENRKEVTFGKKPIVVDW